MGVAVSMIKLSWRPLSGTEQYKRGETESDTLIKRMKENFGEYPIRLDGYSIPDLYNLLEEEGHEDEENYRFLIQQIREHDVIEVMLVEKPY